MNRRTVLAGTGITLSSLLSGCLAGEEEETPESQANESGDSAREEEETDEELPKAGEPEIDAGIPVVQVHMHVTDGHPDDITPISSSDERIANVQVFSDVLGEVEDAARQKSNKEIIGGTFSVWADRETDEGREAMDAKETLPSIEQTLNLDGGGSTEEGVYVTHNGHIIFVFFRVFHQD